MDSTADRLERLERQFRRWRRIGIAFAVLIGSPVILALVAFVMNDGSHEAVRLLVRDQEGRVRMDMGTDPDGTPRLLFFGDGGKVRLVAGVLKGDAPMLWLKDAEGQNRVS